LVDRSRTNFILENIEKRVAEYVGTKHAVVCSSARNAIRFSLLALGIGHEDRVVVPDYACEILPITVFCTGAQPRFCDVDRNTCAMTSTSLKKALGQARANTKATILIHPLGFPADAFAIMELAEKTGISLIEDAAQSLGASIFHRQTGSFGHIGVFSFGKFLNCNLGGAAVTNDQNLADKIRLLKTQEERKALLPSPAYRLIEIFKMSSRENMKKLFWADNILMRQLRGKIPKQHVRIVDWWAAIDSTTLKLWRANALTSTAIDQLMAYDGTWHHRRKMEYSELFLLNSEFHNLEIMLQDRRRIAKEYDELLKENGFHKAPVLTDSEPSYLRYPIFVHDKRKLKRVQEALKSMGYDTECYRYKPLHESRVFGRFKEPARFPNAKYVSQHILPLPIVPAMSHEIIAKISSIVNLKSN